MIVHKILWMKNVIREKSGGPFDRFGLFSEVDWSTPPMKTIFVFVVSEVQFRDVWCARQTSEQNR